MPRGPVRVWRHPLRAGHRRARVSSIDGVETLVDDPQRGPGARIDGQARVAAAARLDDRAVPGEGSGRSLRLDARPCARGADAARSQQRSRRDSIAGPLAPRGARVFSPLALVAIAVAAARVCHGVAAGRHRCASRARRRSHSSRSAAATSSTRVSRLTARRSSMPRPGAARQPRCSRRVPPGPSRVHWAHRRRASRVSPRRGELALILGCRLDWANCVGTLARMPPGGGAPREILEDVVSADWTPDGQALAAIQVTAGEYQLHFPTGEIRSINARQARLGFVRFSPAGDRLAFIEYPVLSDESGVLKVIDLRGPRHDGLERIRADSRSRLVARRLTKSGCRGASAAGRASIYAVPLAGRSA